MDTQGNQHRARHLDRIQEITGGAAAPSEILNAILAVAGIAVTPHTALAMRDTIRSARWLVAYSKRIAAQLDARARAGAHQALRLHVGRA